MVGVALGTRVGVLVLVGTLVGVLVLVLLTGTVVGVRVGVLVLMSCPPPGGVAVGALVGTRVGVLVAAAPGEDWPTDTLPAESSQKYWNDQSGEKTPIWIEYVPRVADCGTFQLIWWLMVWPALYDSLSYARSNTLVPSAW